MRFARRRNWRSDMQEAAAPGVHNELAVPSEFWETGDSFLFRGNRRQLPIAESRRRATTFQDAVRSATLTWLGKSGQATAFQDAGRPPTFTSVDFI